jgi:hypothetical protein
MRMQNVIDVDRGINWGVDGPWVKICFKKYKENPPRCIVYVVKER